MAEGIWKNCNPMKIAGQDKYLDVVELVKNFLNNSCCIKKPLISPDRLSDFLKDEIPKEPGIYCIYDKMRENVLDVGKSKHLNSRIREQLIGVSDRKTGRKKFPRLFFAVLKKDKGIKEKDYNAFDPIRQDEYIKYYQDTIFRPDNFLRVCPTSNHLEAIVLEHILIRYFKGEGQCKYNYQV